MSFKIVKHGAIHIFEHEVETLLATKDFKQVDEIVMPEHLKTKGGIWFGFAPKNSIALSFVEVRQDEMKENKI